MIRMHPHGHANCVCVGVGQAQDQVLPTRIMHLPMAFNEKWTHDAIAKYMKSVRRDAPYLPSNVDFVAANNGAKLLQRTHDRTSEV